MASPEFVPGTGQYRGQDLSISPPTPCLPHLALGVTGHRESNAALAANREAVLASLEQLFSRIDEILGGLGRELAPVRLHSLMVDGVDQLASAMALERKWELVAPLPFGQCLNLAINSFPHSVADAEALCRGEAAADPFVEQRAAAIRAITAQAHAFELADRDEEIAGLFRAALEAPGDLDKAKAFDTQCSDQVALAGKVMIERIDLLIAVWDGKVSNLRGGTGHTIVNALEMGAPVLVIAPQAPENWSILTRPEELLRAGQDSSLLLPAIIAAALGSETRGEVSIQHEAWLPHSGRLWTFYRRIEALFGEDRRPFRGLVVTYEKPDEIAAGSGKALLEAMSRLPGRDDRLTARIAGSILPQFAWSDGISSRLSDAYRSGMCYNFILSAFAVIAGAAYLPGDLSEHKWAFAAVELLLLSAILAITFVGGRKRWHTRWFETRRVAEYLRHAPIMLLLGVTRPAGRWPRGKDSEWPEQFARHCLRDAGLPRARMDRSYLREVLAHVLLPHAASQRDYHRAKAARLAAVHHNLDKLAETFFMLAVFSVSLYLLLKLGSLAGLLPDAWPYASSKLFTFLGIAFPTLGASVAGIRFFADFERFAAISQVAAEKLDRLHARIVLLLSAPPTAVTYARAAELTHVLDEIVVDEIESWQAVFGGKHIALPA